MIQNGCAGCAACGTAGVPGVLPGGQSRTAALGSAPAAAGPRPAARHNEHVAATGTVIRDAASGDAEALAGLAAGLATSFPFSRAAFDAAFGAVRPAGGTCLLVAEQGGELRGYLLGFDHVTFFANGRVAWAEELMVENGHRRAGIGRALMEEFERRSAARGCKLVALATRRAAAFYRAIGYEESAAYLRKTISAPPTQ